jgi:quinol monooxygenase YgiN
MVTNGNEVAWVFELQLQPGRRADFEALMPELVKSTRDEPGARAYHWFGDDESDVLCAYERYVDSDAAMAHMALFGEKFAARFMEMVTPVRFTVLGSPSQELVDALTPIGAVVFPPLVGFLA